VLALWYVASRPMDPSDATYCYFRQKEPSVTTTFERPTRTGQENTKCFQSDGSLSAIVIFCYRRLDQMSYERALPVTVA
jgi:hypothetical protein